MSVSGRPADPETLADEKRQFMPVNPRPFLQDLYVFPSPPPRSDAHRTRQNDELTTTTCYLRVNKDIFVRLKWNETEYKGRL